MKKGSKQGGAIAGFDSFMSKIRNFLVDTVAELGRCTWPTRQQLLESTLLVVVNVVILASFVYVVDLISVVVVRWISTGTL